MNGFSPSAPGEREGNGNPLLEVHDLTVHHGQLRALDHISLYVGSTAANMSAVDTASQMNQQQINSSNNQLNSLIQTNLPNATVQLQQIQMQYQASLSAGSRILNLSILNYLPTS